MLGGGQLGRFFVIAAHELGYRVVVLDPMHKAPPAASPTGTWWRPTTTRMH
jgi:phosphoribosylaminoimidazole carboxylase (NCAIR synthetase)